MDRTHRLGDLTCGSLVSEIASWRLGAAESIVTEALEEIRAAAEAEVPAGSVSPDLQETIVQRTQRLLGS